MQDVVLEEADGPGAGTPSTHGAAPEGPDAPGGRGVPSARRHRSGRLAVAGAVLALAVAAGVVDARREAAETARVLDAPRALAPLDGPVRELWRASDVVLADPVRVGDVLVGTGYRPDGAAQAVGVDAATGRTVWATTLASGRDEARVVRCATPEGPGGPDAGATGEAPPTASGRVTTCVVTPEAGDATPGAAATPTASRSFALDPGTGGRLDERTVPAGSSLAALGSDLVTSHLDDTGALHLARTDALGHRVRWAWTSPEPLGPGEHGRSAWLTVRDDVVLAGGDHGWALSADGVPVHHWRPSPRGAGWIDVVGPGLLVQPGPGALSSEVVDLTTSRTFAVEGVPVPAAVDDGSAPDLVLAQMPGDRFGAFRRGTGRPVWSVPDAATGGAGLVVVGGQVVRTHDTGLSALDARTGAVRWTTDLRARTQYTLLTDGHLVLCVVDDPDRGAVLGAYDLGDGRLRWDVDLADDVQYLFAADGLLLGLGDRHLVAYG